MYCNLFDSVRTTRLDYAQAEGLLFNMILSGYHPTLSVNQAVDSNLIMGLCSEYSEFLKLISLGAIRVAPFGRFGSIADYLDHNLKPIPDQDRNPYRFSSLAFLYDHEMYSDTQIQRIYNAMRQAIHDSSIRLTRDLTANNLHKEILNDSLHTFRELSRVLDGKYLRSIDDRSPNLSQRVDDFIISLEASHPGIVPPALLELHWFFCTQRREHGIAPDGSQDAYVRLLSSRSYLFHVLEKITGGMKDWKAEATAIINLCYNEKVAASLGDNEDDLMVVETTFPSLRCYAQHSGRKQQALLLSDADDGTEPPISWSDLLAQYTTPGAIPAKPNGLGESPLVFRAGNIASSNKCWRIQLSGEYVDYVNAGQATYPIALLNPDYAEEY